MSKIKKLFPFFDKNNEIIYFDNAATTLKPNNVINSISNFYKYETANATRSQFEIAWKLNNKIQKIRKLIQVFINANSYKGINFTPGATHSLNYIANYLDNYFFINKYFLKKRKNKFEILICKHEHSSDLFPWLALANKYKKNIKIKFIDVDLKLKITLKQVKEKFTKFTKLIIINSISNVFGKINEISKIGLFANRNNCLFVVDATQSVAHIPTNCQKWKCDFLAFSAHKMYGPFGIGILYIDQIQIKNKKFPIYQNNIVGGGAIDRIFDNLKFKRKNNFYGNESGTLNYSGILGLGSAIKFINKIGFNQIIKKDKKLVKYAMKWFKNLSNIELYNPDPDIPIFSFNIKEYFCQDTAFLLNHYKICVRSGDNCVKINKLFNKSNKYVRASLGIYNNCQELKKFFKIIKQKKEFLHELFEN